MKKKKAKRSVPMPALPAQKRPLIDEIEAVLNSEGDAAIEILPNGEVRAVSAEEVAKRPKPLTMRENLGGEYGEVA